MIYKHCVCICPHVYFCVYTPVYIQYFFETVLFVVGWEGFRFTALLPFTYKSVTVIKVVAVYLRVIAVIKVAATEFRTVYVRVWNTWSIWDDEFQMDFRITCLKNLSTELAQNSKIRGLFTVMLQFQDDSVRYDLLCCVCFCVDDYLVVVT